MSKSREGGLDLMRIISALVIVFFHCASAMFRTMIMGTEPYDDFTNMFLLLLVIWTKASVDFFFMVSGAFVLSSPRTQDLKSFYGKMWKKLCIPTIAFLILFSAAYLINDLIFYPAIDDAFISSYVTMVIQGEPGAHLWYMFVLIGLYLLAPAIQHMKDLLGFKAFTIVAIVLSVLGYCGECTSTHFLDWDPGYILNNAGIFMLGYSIHEWSSGKKSTGKGIGMIIGGIAVMVVYMICSMFGVGNGILFVGTLFQFAPQSPLSILTAALFMAGIMRLDIKKDFSKVGALTYGVYLIHPLFQLLGYDIMAVAMNVPTNAIRMDIPQLAIMGTAVALISFILTFLFYRIFGSKKKNKSAA